MMAKLSKRQIRYLEQYYREHAEEINWKIDIKYQVMFSPEFYREFRDRLDWRLVLGYAGPQFTDYKLVKELSAGYIDWDNVGKIQIVWNLLKNIHILRKKVFENEFNN